MGRMPTRELVIGFDADDTLWHNESIFEQVMVGNSLKSDILPVLALGGAAAYIPYHLTWAHEHVDDVPFAEGRFFRLKTLRELTEVVAACVAE
jgi:putative hydrolase of the HAD superfamily